MNKNVLWVLFSFLVFVQCNKNQITFPVTKELKGSNLPLKTAIYPKQIEVFDSLLIIEEYEPLNGTFLDFFNLKDNKLIASSGSVGKGPGEMINPAKFTIDEENNLLWCQDWGKNKVWQFIIDSILESSEYKPNNSISINEELIPISSFSHYKNGLFAFTTYKRFVVFMNENGELVDSLEIQNKSDLKVWANLDYLSKPFVFDFFPKKNQIVVANSYENYISCIDLRGNLLFELYGNELNNEYAESRWDYYLTYSDIQVKDEYIYCLYYGNKRGIYDKEKDIIQYQNPRNIHVFSLEGNPVANLHLDEELFRFTIKGNDIYGITGDFANIRHYAIPEL